MLGAIAGDIIGSIYEHNNIKTKDFSLFDSRCRFTDDTVCSIAVAEALLTDGDYARALRKFGNAWFHKGYGKMFRTWLQSDAGPYNSWGNGSAMRVSAIPYLATSEEEVLEWAEESSAVTHSHPLGIKGALAVALAMWRAKENVSTAEIRSEIAERFDYDMSRSVDEIRPGYFFDVSAEGTVPVALTCALEANDFEDAIRNAISVGGDSDTVATIAGGLAEIMFGMPEYLQRKVVSYLPAYFLDVLEGLGRVPFLASIPSTLRYAYEQTEFVARADQEFVLRIGKKSEEIQGLYENAGVSSAAFITAWNPLGADRGTQFNNQAHQKLLQVVRSSGWAHFSGVGRDPSGEYAGEESLLILGLAEEEAEELGREFQQNAIVWIDSSCISRLHYLAL